MFTTAIAGLLLVTSISVSQPTPTITNLERPSGIEIAYAQPTTIATFESEEVVQEILPAEEIQPEVISYTVKKNDSLSKIALEFNSTWKRIYDKNLSISNPDIITAGTVIIIPNESETLAERPLPTQAVTVTTTQKPIIRASAAVTQTSYASRGTSSGNLYTPGYCTWYVKNKRPNLPNNLGNADTWVSRAAAQGIPTGTTPQVGSVGQRGMHVVYVESVNGDGTVTISEMNHKGLYVITWRTLPANYFTYIL
jgi:surface antigen